MLQDALLETADYRSLMKTREFTTIDRSSCSPFGEMLHEKLRQIGG